MKEIKRFEIRIAGFGGQGVVTIGRILGTAISMYEGKNSVNTQSYGPESRGGACRSEVVISDSEIFYPGVRRADIFVALSQIACDAYISDLKSGGILIVDQTAVKNIPDRKDIVILKLPAMEIAEKLGGIKFQNMVVLGAISANMGWVSSASLERAIKESVPYETLALNLEAFKIGRNYTIHNKSDVEEV